MQNIPLVPTDVDDLLLNVRAELKLANASGPVWFHIPDMKPTSSLPSVRSIGSSIREEDPVVFRIANRLAKLRSYYPELLQQARSIGDVPPATSSIRARFGALVIRIANRFLWWQTWAVKRYAESVNYVLLQHFHAVEDLQRTSADKSDNLRIDAEIQQLRKDVSDLRSKVRQDGTAVNSVSTGSAESTQDFSEMLKLSREQNADLRERAVELFAAVQQIRTELTVQGGRAGLFLEEARRRLPEPLTPAEVERVLSEIAHRFDSVYLAFENIFGGSREQVKERRVAYLPALKSVRGNRSLGPVLDLGCGRGEWLELMRENQIAASGVDSNRAMVNLCRSLSLDVIESNALSHLRSISDSSLGAVTCFHIVEQLPFEQLISIIDECRRVLQPGGLLLLETPNPRNLLVGSCTFHMDPMNPNPIPAPMLRFFIEARGFVGSEILELNPYPVLARLEDAGNAIAKELKQRLFGPQEYGIIARRA